MPKRLIEAGKTLLIVLLLISSVFLAGKTELYYNFIEAVPAFAGIARLFDTKSLSAAAADSNVSITDSIIPLSAVVTSKYGDHCGIKYDSNALSTFNNRINALLSEALKPVSSPIEVSEEEWKLALSSVGFFIDLNTPVHFSAFFKSSDSRLLSERATDSVRRICVAASQNRVFLYYINEEDGTFFRSLTGIFYNTLAANVSEFLPNDAKFAFEMGDTYKNLNPYTVLLKSKKVMSAIVANPFYERISREKIIEQFGFNSLHGTLYNESSTSSVFVGEFFTLRMNSDGTASYRVTGSANASLLKIKSPGSAPTEFEILESAGNLVSSALGTACGVNTCISLTGFEYSTAEKSWRISFDYFVNGIPVKLSSYRHAAEIEVVGENITSAFLVFRNYVLLDNIEKILPERQAAALVGENGEPSLFYLDDGSGRLMPGWTEK